MIFATGGTIAGRGASSTASGVYQAGSIGVGALVDGKPTFKPPSMRAFQSLTVCSDHSSDIAVPELLGVSNIYGVQIANVGSPSIVSPPPEHLEPTYFQADTTTPLLDR